MVINVVVAHFWYQQNVGSVGSIEQGIKLAWANGDLITQSILHVLYIVDSNIF